MLIAMPGRYIPQTQIAMEVARKVDELVMGASPRTGMELLSLEERSLSVGRELSDGVVAHHIEKAHEDERFKGKSMEASKARGPHRLRGSGERVATIRLRGGGTVQVSTPYQERDRRGSRGRRRGRGRRGKKGGGRYPVLEALGIQYRSTPLVLREVARQVVTASSYREAQAQLAREGFQADVKTLRRLAVGLGEELVGQREKELSLATRNGGPEEGGPLAGRRVLVSTDGGRARVRVPNGQGRPKANGRKGFKTQWREPRGLLIQVLDDKGRPDKTLNPWLDMGVWDADETMDKLTAWLIHLGAGDARELIFTADGADWIWNRVWGLVQAIGLARSKVTKVADFYHACEHVHAAVEACKDLKKKQREALYRRLSRQLYHGALDEVIDELKRRARGRRSKKIKTEIAYLTERRELMDYPGFRDRGIPMGSGSMESAIRRVNNLRFKGPGIIWRLEHLQPLLHVRALVKSGRYEQAYERLMRANQAHVDATLDSDREAGPDDNCYEQQPLKAA